VVPTIVVTDELASGRLVEVARLPGLPTGSERGYGRRAAVAATVPRASSSTS
jgi:hypothetical protein